MVSWTTECKSWGEIPHFFCRQPRFKFFFFLATGAAFEKDTFGITPAAAAALTGHTDIVEYLITSKRISDQVHVIRFSFKTLSLTESFKNQWRSYLSSTYLSGKDRLFAFVGRDLC